MPARPLPERESLAEVAAAGVGTIAWVTAAGADEAAAAVERVGLPAVLKVDALGLAHKSDAGAVRLGLATADDVRRAAHELLELPLPDGAVRRGLLVQAMAPPGVELLVGMRRDPQFGPVVLVGLGGVLAEVLDDVTLRLAPVTRGQALAMLDDLRGSAVLAGTRGRPAVDRDAVADLLVALARLAAERPGILEVDLNPVVAWAGGAVAVDALVVMAGEPG